MLSDLIGWIIGIIINFVFRILRLTAVFVRRICMWQ